ncbi:alpha/beta hydrolase [Archangium lansingense]|uniref:alpha/beta hydrolase n=1 Tax=Archangium lansingense TaxID=2995310 RepID=UPI003B8051AD
MYMISSREKFWSSTELSASDEIRDVDLTDDSLGQKVSTDELRNVLRSKRVLLLIHGYNSEEDDVVRAYTIIEKMLTSNQGTRTQYDHILGYSWPGGDDPLDYFAARRKASAISRRVASWLGVLSEEATAFDIMTHSMGGRVALLALSDPTMKQPENKPVVRNLFTTAAAVDNESIQYGEKHYTATQACQFFFVFHSRKDPVLERWYRAAEFDRALGLDGPEDPASIVRHSPNVRVVNCKQFIKEHGGYKQCLPLYDHLGKVLSDQPDANRQYVTLGEAPAA